MCELFGLGSATAIQPRELLLPFGTRSLYRHAESHDEARRRPLSSPHVATVV